MSDDIEIWNALHDGIISIFAGESESTLTVFVHIPYLRRRIKPAGVCFVLKLYGVKSCIFTDFNGNEEESLADTFDSNTPQILSTQSESMPVLLHTLLGRLILEYDSIKCFLDSGDEIDCETIFNVCTEFWEEWSNKHKREWVAGI